MGEAGPWAVELALGSPGMGGLAECCQLRRGRDGGHPKGWPCLGCGWRPWPVWAESRAPSATVFGGLGAWMVVKLEPRDGPCP